MPFIEMMQCHMACHFEHRREWELDHSSSVSRVCFVICKKFEGNFTMAPCSFVRVSNAMPWAAHETGMVPLLSCEIDMTEWLKEKYKG